MVTTLEQSNRQTQLGEYGLDPFLKLYLPLWKRDGVSLMSDDAYGHLCTVIGALWTPRGRRFAGDDKITIPTITLADNTPWTIIFWVSPTEVATGYDGLYGNAFTVGNYTRCYFQTTIQAVSNDANASATWTAPMTAVTQQLAFVCDGTDSNNMEFFINTVSQGKRTLADSSQTIKVLGEVGGGISPFTGLIHEILICNRAFTLTERQQNYLATKWRYI